MTLHRKTVPTVKTIVFKQITNIQIVSEMFPTRTQVNLWRGNRRLKEKKKKEKPFKKPMYASIQLVILKTVNNVFCILNATKGHNCNNEQQTPQRYLVVVVIIVNITQLTFVRTHVTSKHLWQLIIMRSPILAAKQMMYSE